MAKKFYIPVKTGNQYLSKEVKKWLIPILEQGQQNPVSHKVVKAYVAVKNGNQYLSKLFFEYGKKQGFWFYFATAIGKIIEGKRYTIVPNQVQVDINKTGSGITFYLFIQQTQGGSIIENLVITLSTDQSATAYDAVCQGQTDSYTNIDSIVEYGDTWYYTTGAPIEYNYSPQAPADIKPNCVVRDENIAELYDVQDIVEQFLLEYIYTSDYAESYQKYSYYDLNISSIEYMARKLFAIFLFKNVSKKTNVNYIALLQKFDEIIQHIVDFAANNNCNCVSSYGAPDDSYLIFYFEFANLNTVPVRIVSDEEINYGYSRYGSSSQLGSVTLYKLRIMITSGSVIYQNNGTSQDTFNSRLGVNISSYGTWLAVSMSNTGVDLHI